MQNSILALLLITAICGPCDGFCQCVPAGPANGNNFGNDASAGTFLWNNTSNAKTSDNQFASASMVLTAFDSVNTEYLTAENFGFAIPSTASICGIQVTVQHLASGITGLFGVTLGTVSDNSVMIINNGIISGSEHKSAASWTETSTTATYGSPGDTWGIVNWLPSDINAANFGIAISAKLSALVGVTLGANIDYISITVSYIDPGVLSLLLQNFKVSEEQNVSLISWGVQSPNVLSDFSVQRSTDAVHWQDIGELAASMEYTKYTYTDQSPVSGINYYRIELIDKNGAVEYSGIASVDLQYNNDITVYPNPASSYINISSVKNIHSVSIKNTGGQPVEFIRSNNSSGNISLNISRLAAGIYFLQIDNLVYKLIKK
ncbi:MAG TPA: T9SS type A sorting domain-containing protein [Puia sp.]|nr:T9SS type A sorting domain-containing protein [Puia sp.]